MRGKIISLSSNKKNKESSRISELVVRIKSLEVAYSDDQEEHILNELRKACQNGKAVVSVAAWREGRTRMQMSQNKNLIYSQEHR